MANYTNHSGLLPRPPPPRLGVKPKVWSVTEQRQQRDLAEALLSTAQGTEAYATKQLAKQLHLTFTRARRVVREVLDAWNQKREGTKAVEDARSQAIARVRSMLVHARGTPKVVDDPLTGGRKQDGWLVEPDHRATAKYEEILMRLEGTDQPIKVDVNVRVSAALEGVIANLTPQQVERFVARRRELERLADLARARLPECIEAVGVEAGD